MSLLRMSEKLAAVGELAASQSGIVSRRQLRELGIPDWHVRTEFQAGRWKAYGTFAIAIHTGPLDERANMWVAVIVAGRRCALDGASALIAAGLTGFSMDHIRLSVPRGTKTVCAPGAVVRQTRRLRRSDIIDVGLPRVRPPIAAVRAGLWAQSNKQAALVVAMTVQQGIATAESIGVALLDVKRDKRRRFLEAIVLDLLDGAQSLGEIDFAKECRRRGLPKPDRQHIRRGKDGRYYLDVRWIRYGVVVEVDGIHHKFAVSVVPDAFRQNEVSLDGDIVLRLPLLALRVAADAFFDQIERALIANGWQNRAAS